MDQYISVAQDGRLLDSEKRPTAVGVVCADHRECKRVSKKEIKDLLGKVFQTSRILTQYVDNLYLGVWVDGQEECLIESKSELWKTDECRFCHIEEFLSGPGRFPWTVCLKFRDEEEAYCRTMGYMQSIKEDVDGWEKWVDGIITAAKNGKYSKVKFHIHTSICK